MYYDSGASDDDMYFGVDDKMNMLFPFRIYTTSPKEVHINTFVHNWHWLHDKIII